MADKPFISQFEVVRAALTALRKYGQPRMATPGKGRVLEIPDGKLGDFSARWEIPPTKHPQAVRIFRRGEEVLLAELEPGWENSDEKITTLPPKRDWFPAFMELASGL